MIQKKYFGTDGIRGEVGQSFINPEFMLKLGWAAGKCLARRTSGSVLIGKDTRISGYMLESALQAGFSAAGIDTLLLGPMPTPAIAYLTQSIRASAGVVISASHNAYQDNGIKFFDGNGFKLSDALEFNIEELIDSPMMTVASEHLGKSTRMVDAPGRYIEFCKNTFPANLSLKGLTVVVDCANGAAYSVAPEIFTELGAQVTAIANNPNGLNINKQCGATDINFLAETVKINKADLGIALDGDGDRVILVDSQGELVDGDEILAMIAIHRIDRARPTGVVGTVMSNLGLEQTLAKYDIEFVRAKVGDRYVLDQLQRQGWLLGGEASGHVVDLNYTTTGDGIITALQVLRIMQETNKPLAQLKQVMIKRPQILTNVPVCKKDFLLDQKELHEALARAELALGNRGRVLLRPSGTEQVLRVMVEGNDMGEVTSIAEQLATIVKHCDQKGRSHDAIKP